MMRRTRAFLGIAALAAPAIAHASFLSGEALDTAANALSWFIIIVMPFVAIGAFLYVHVLPEVIAERRQHPHKDSIKVLCILSLFFGGLLWPFAWLWAYTKPIGYRAIYGTEMHDDYFLEMADKARTGKLSDEEIRQLHHELESMAAKAPLSPSLRSLKADLETLASAPGARERSHHAAEPAGGGNE